MGLWAFNSPFGNRFLPVVGNLDYMKPVCFSSGLICSVYVSKLSLVSSTSSNINVTFRIRIQLYYFVDDCITFVILLIRKSILKLSELLRIAHLRESLFEY